MNYIGDFAEDSTIRIALTTNNTSGAAVAPSTAFEADDFRIYKNGSAAQKTTTNGITIASPFDSVTGLHTLEIDTSNDTGDSGFWTTGADYWIVAVPDETVASQTVVQVIAAFSIENRLRVKSTDEVSANLTKVAGSAVNTSTAQLGVNVIQAAGTAWGSGAITAGSIASNAITSAKIATDAIGAAQVATDAVTEIQSGLATSTALSAIPNATRDATLGALLVDYTSTGTVGYVLNAFFAMIEYVTGWRFTTKAVEQVSGPDVYVYPYSMGQEPRNVHQEITVYTDETGSQHFYAVDTNNTAIDLTGKTLEFRIADSKTKRILYTAKTSDGTLTVTLTNKVTFTKSTKFTRYSNTDVTYSLRDMDAGAEVLLEGPLRLRWAP